MIAFDKIIDITKKVLTKAVPSTTVPTDSFILLAFFIFYLPNYWYLLVFTVYMIKYGAKQKYLLPSHVTNNKSKEVFINKCIISMEINDKLKIISIKNCTCYYFDAFIKSEDVNSDNVLIEEKS